MKALPALLLLAACAGDDPVHPAGGADAFTDDPQPTDGDDGGEDGADGTDDGDSGGWDTGEVRPDGPPIIILFIGDGMGFEHVAGGGLYATGDRAGLNLWSAPVQGRVRSASLSGYTDSAAAATTLASGERTWNGDIGIDRDGDEVVTLLDLASARGMAIGVVTTDLVTGATPSAFLVHADDRYETDAIAAALGSSLPDLLIGGGATQVADDLDPETTQIALSWPELKDLSPDGRPLVGLVAPGVMPFAFDAIVDMPTQVELVDYAFDRLQDDPEGMVLIFEGARIDHASHLNLTSRVHAETAALDAAIQRALERIAATPEREATVVVTADHECGGLRVAETGEVGVPADSRWRWLDHTNSDVGVWAWGNAAEPLNGQRMDHRWTFAALRAAVTGEPLVAPPDERLVDGFLDDIGPAVATQSQPTDFGAGYNQLDGLRVDADAEGLWVGIDGAFDDDDNSVLVFVDLDLGAGTGAGADLDLDDLDAEIDALMSSLGFAPTLSGLGFDAAAGTIAGSELRYDFRVSHAGLRLFRPPHGSPTNFWWQSTLMNFDDGNLAWGEPARDALDTGRTEGGLEMRLPWSQLYPANLPTAGATLGVLVVLVNRDGSVASNQALPAWSSATAPDPAALPVAQVVQISVDGDGLPLGPATLSP